MESKIQYKWTCIQNQNRFKNTHKKNLWLPKRKGLGEGKEQIRSMGLTDINLYIK